MHTAVVVITLITAAANGAIAVGDLLRAPAVVDNAHSVGVTDRWIPALGLLKAAGALGLVLGLVGVPVIGEAAAAGLVLFFVGAVIAHIQVRAFVTIGVPVVFLALAATTLVLSLTTR